MVANASTHHGDSFEVQFMAKIGEINQEIVSRRKKSRWRKRNFFKLESKFADYLEENSNQTCI